MNRTKCRTDIDRHGGFSLIEMVIALVVVLGTAGVTFQLLAQNERIFRDQATMLEMHQSVRAVAAMIADDIYSGGQGVPVFAASLESATSEHVQVFLAGTDGNRLQLRSNTEYPESVLVGNVPLLLDEGRPLSIRPRSPAFRPGVGRHVFLWGESGGTWTWARARVDDRGPSGGFVITPLHISSEGGLLTSPPRVAEERGLSWRLSGRSLLRGELQSFDGTGNPIFRELSVGDHFRNLEFIYRDQSGEITDPTSLAGRNAIRSVDVVVEGETSGPLSNGSSPGYSLSMSVVPRGLSIP